MTATPYYADEYVTLWNGDCLDLLPRVTATVLVTDPPYGLAMGDSNDQRPYDRGQRHSHGLARKSYAGYEDTYENYLSVVVPAVTEAIKMTRRAAVFTGPHMWELPKPDAIGGVYHPSAAGRNTWGFKNFLPVLFYGKAPELNKGSYPTVLRSTASAEKNGHPCPKPLPWMQWLVGLAARPEDTVLDPFAGSGTTLVAAKQAGYRAIGIESDERYCEIAAKRLAGEVPA